MNRFLFLVLFNIFHCFSSTSQVTFYKTYKNFINNVGESYEGYKYKNCFYTVGTQRCEFSIVDEKTKKSKSVKRNLNRIWGFKYLDKLYIMTKDNDIACLAFQGEKICCYTNGCKEMGMSIPLGATYYISMDINTEIVPLIRGRVMNPSTSNHRLVKLAKKYPESSDIIECIRQCVIKSVSFGPCLDKLDVPKRSK